MLEKQVLSQQEAGKRTTQKLKNLIDQAFIERDTEEAVFRAMSEDAFKLLEPCDVDKDVVPALRKVQQALDSPAASLEISSELCTLRYKYEIGTLIVVTNTSNFRYSAKPELRRFP